MYVVVQLNDSSDECAVTLKRSYKGALKFLRKHWHMPEASLEDIQNATKGENDITTTFIEKE